MILARVLMATTLLASVGGFLLWGLWQREIAITAGLKAQVEIQETVMGQQEHTINGLADLSILNANLIAKAGEENNEILREGEQHRITIQNLRVTSQRDSLATPWKVGNDIDARISNSLLLLYETTAD